MHKFFRNNGLSLVLFLCFLIFIGGQYVTGLQEFNEQLKDAHRPTVDCIQYLSSGHFLEATFENWESEFLQMSAYIIFTIMLFQKGSSESKDPDEAERSKEKEATKGTGSKAAPDAPYPVHRGGLLLKLYENSLSIVFILLFVLSFGLHAYGGTQLYNIEQSEHGRKNLTVTEFIGTNQFWFESFQNWQSEFLSMGFMVVLSVYLRQKGSPESKKVEDPHHKTGSE